MFVKKCLKCDEKFWYSSDECKWDERGSVPTKIAKCSHCGSWNPVRYEMNRMENVNTDVRYYVYKKLSVR